MCAACSAKYLSYGYDMQVTVSANNEFAIQSKRKSLNPQAWVILTGFMRVDTPTFLTGEELTIHHIALTKALLMVEVR